MTNLEAVFVGLICMAIGVFLGWLIEVSMKNAESISYICITILILVWWFKEPISKLMGG